MSLSGAQNLIFLGLNFVTISLDSCHVKNQFLGPSRVVKETPLGPLLPFFSFLFFSRFFVFFLLFFHFSLFLFISSFFDFSMFFIFISSIFPKKQFLLFFFSCIYFNFFLLALVSEFNCFLRTRCSMEMWCPDDIGRDSWDWVGPPVKTEPPQIVLLLLLFL